MSELSIFEFDKLPVRVVMINDEPWFVASDVAKILGYARPHEAVAAHCKHAKHLNSLGAVNHRLYENQQLDPKTYLIPESDLYRLIIKSKLPAAERFERFVMETLLPTLRKEGRYALKPQNSLEANDLVNKIMIFIETSQANQLAMKADLLAIK